MYILYPIVLITTRVLHIALCDHSFLILFSLNDNLPLGSISLTAWFTNPWFQTSKFQNMGGEILKEIKWIFEPFAAFVELNTKNDDF